MIYHFKEKEDRTKTYLHRNVLRMDRRSLRPQAKILQGTMDCEGNCIHVYNMFIKILLKSFLVIGTGFFFI